MARLQSTLNRVWIPTVMMLMLVLVSVPRPARGQMKDAVQDAAATVIEGALREAMAGDGDLPDAPETAAVVTREATRPNFSSDGRPLPLVAHWHRRSLPPTFQAEMIRKGHHVLPWIAYSRRLTPEAVEQKYGDGLRLLRKWNLPIVLITGGQWEQDFYAHPEYTKLPAEETGVAVSAKTGKKISAVSPFSPVEPWGKLGRNWTDNPGCRKIQEIYPDPPLIIFVSNNEAHDFRWYNAEKEKRYLELYGEGRSDEFKRRVFADGWAVRYAELIRGMRSGLVNPNWKSKSLFVAYNAIGPDHFGRPDLASEGGWKKYSTASESRLDWQPYAWEGAIPESYDNHWEPEKTASRVWSMQTEMMNLWFMKRDAMNLNAGFWMEVIFWDGNLPAKDNDKYKRYRELGYEYTPERYRGWVQYNMWNLRPRVAREWRASNDDKDRWWDYFSQVIQSVDRVHQDDTLKKFWRHGEIVVNEEAEHPFNADLPERWRDEPRWFHLPTSTDPARPWQLDTKIPVYTLALRMGDTGSREWLLYAHAPMDPQKDVEVTIPDYGKVKLAEVPIGGAFWHVSEKDKAIRSVGD